MTNQPQAPGRPPSPAERRMAPPSLDATAGPLVTAGPDGAPQTASSGPFAKVLLYKDNVRLVKWPDGRVTGGKGRWREPLSTRLVDVGRHRSSFSAELPARGGSVHFIAEVDIAWQVVDPVRVVDMGLANVAGDMEPELVAMLRRITAGHRITDPTAAELEAEQYLGGSRGRSLGDDRGLEVRVFVRLRPSVEVADVVRDGEVDIIKSVQLQERVVRFSNLIAAGDVQQFAFLMAQDPGQIPTVMNEIWRRQHESHDQTLDFVKELIKSGVVERYQISDEVDTLLGWMQATTNTVIGRRPPVQELTAHPAPRLIRGGEVGGAQTHDSYRYYEDSRYEDPRDAGPQRRRRRAEPTAPPTDRSPQSDAWDGDDGYDRHDRHDRHDRDDHAARGDDRRGRQDRDAPYGARDSRGPAGSAPRTRPEAARDRDSDRRRREPDGDFASRPATAHDRWDDDFEPDSAPGPDTSSETRRRPGERDRKPDDGWPSEPSEPSKPSEPSPAYGDPGRAAQTSTNGRGHAADGWSNHFDDWGDELA